MSSAPRHEANVGCGREVSFGGAKSVGRPPHPPRLPRHDCANSTSSQIGSGEAQGRLEQSQQETTQSGGSAEIEDA